MIHLRFVLLLLVPIWPGSSWAQIPARPAGVIAPPVLPATSYGQPTVQKPLRPYLLFNSTPLVGGGYLPFWPAWYENEPAPTIINNYFAIPAQPVAVQPPKPIAESARLTLTVPSGAKVLFQGKELDTAISPLVLESPPLKVGQRYSFTVKVTWEERGKTQERKRTIDVEAGDGKSLTYFR